MTSDDSTMAIVADADVLAADILVGGASREALDILRAHDWITLVASDRLLDDATAVVETLADETLASDWRGRIDDLAETVSQPPSDHPGLASAMVGDAKHLLTLDDSLTSTRVNVSLQNRIAVSIRTPEAFVSVFDAQSMYEVVVGGPYPGLDRDPRG